MKNKKNLYLVWNPFQRRAQTLANSFGCEALYYYFKFEEKGAFFKFISYFLKSISTLIHLVRYKPDYIFLQLAPTPLLYVAALYCGITRCVYVSDCHNTMLYDAHWIHWPLAKWLLRRSKIVIVHNTDVQKHANNLSIPSVILRDPLPVIDVPKNINTVAGINIKEETYIIVPCSMAIDEPIEELFAAIRQVPEALFVVTWFQDRLPANIRSQAPGNLRFTGFLDEPEFNALYANSNAAIVLTTREGTQPSGASEAISLGVPLVVSEIATTRRLYGDKPVYVDNSPESIAKGAKLALANYDAFSEAITQLKSGLVEEAEQQIEDIKKVLEIS